MVSFLFLFLLATTQPFDIECPQEVVLNENFTLKIICSEPGCSGINLINSHINSSSNIVFSGSSTATQISSVSTQNGQQLSQMVVFSLRFTPTDIGEQSIGPLEVNIGGLGVYTLEQISINVVPSNNSVSNSNTAPHSILATTTQTLPDRQVWLKGILQDPNGKIYPGTILNLDYYVHATVGVSDVTYYWTAPEFGVIRNVETISDSNWDTSPLKHDNSTRSLLARVQMSPAAPGSLLAPIFSADIIGEGFNRWGKQPAWFIESDSIVLPVYPLPPNPPADWNGDLLDSVTVKIEQLPTPVGQGGELTIRLTSIGDGNIYMNTPPAITVNGAANLIEADTGSSQNKKWWDYIIEPEETGLVVLGPDSLVWLNRRTGCYITEIIQPCSLYARVIPWNNTEINLPEKEGKNAPIFWLTLALVSIIGFTIILVMAAKKRDNRLVSIKDAKDIDEFITGLENEFSVLLNGKKEYLGYEELDAYLNNRNIDSFLTRRILRFWRSLEMSVSGKEITFKELEHLKNIAEELLYKLKKDLRINSK